MAEPTKQEITAALMATRLSTGILDKGHGTFECGECSAWFGFVDFDREDPVKSRPAFCPKCGRVNAT